jgi:glycosyltransferase involved in cell wall biosynthesis
MDLANNLSLSKAKVALVCAAPLTFNAFMRGHILKIGSQYQLSVVCSGNDSDLHSDILGVSQFESVPIRREIAPIKDLYALYQLFLLFRSKQYRLVHSITPKAGLLAMGAGYLSRLPVRIHTFTGQVWATKKGFSRFLLKTIDQITATLATHVLADSLSQRLFLIDQGIVAQEKIQVLEHGSISGVDSERFKPDVIAREGIRSRLGITEEAVVAIFVGRLTRDKGVLDLVSAFNRVSELAPNLHLLIVGPDEQNLANEIQKLAPESSDRLHILGPTAEPEKMMAAADFFCLPSYREGFGSVVIEAAATGLPALASNIYGLTDAIDQGKTGFLHEARSIDQISSFLVTYALDSELRLKMGENARKRALELFSSDRLVDAQMHFYENALLSAKRR